MTNIVEKVTLFLKRFLVFIIFLSVLIFIHHAPKDNTQADTTEIVKKAVRYLNTTNSLIKTTKSIAPLAYSDLEIYYESEQPSGKMVKEINVNGAYQRYDRVIFEPVSISNSLYHQVETITRVYHTAKFDKTLDLKSKDQKEITLIIHAKKTDNCMIISQPKTAKIKN